MIVIDFTVLTDREIKHLKVWTHKTSLPHPLSFSLTFVFIEMLVTSQESERSSCICVLGVANFNLSTIFLLAFLAVPTE